MGISLTLKDIFAPARDEAIDSSFLDTDFYKLPMGYFVWRNPEYRNVEVTFELIIRDPKIKLAKVIPEDVLREQLDASRKVQLTSAEASFVGGMTLSDNKTPIIPGNYLAELCKMDLPGYSLETTEDSQYRLRFTGPWWKVKWWEIKGMKIVSELFYYHLIKYFELSEFEVVALYTKMIQILHQKINFLKKFPQVKYMLFDTRRRHSLSWQEFVMWTMRSEIPNQCLGSSNVKLSMRHGSANPFGTNAHGLPMVKACLAGDDVEKIKSAQYEIVEEWYDVFGEELSIMLIDTFGTKQFLDNAPEWMAHKYKGCRPDSMNPDTATDMMVKWWEKHGVDPKTKLILPSDGLDVESMITHHERNKGKVGTVSFGWGTMAGNDCRDAWPRESGCPFFRPFSMVCKVVEANGVPAVKLSDNPKKATGDPKRVEFFKKIFGTEGSKSQEVVV